VPNNRGRKKIYYSKMLSNVRLTSEEKINNQKTVTDTRLASGAQGQK
jgi:hypothetical protein